MTVTNLYRLTWISTLLFAVEMLRQHLLARHLNSSQEWALVYSVVRGIITILLTLSLLWVTRRKQSIEGRFGWSVGLMLLFLIDWSTLVSNVRESFELMPPHRLIMWSCIMAVVAIVASRLSDWRHRRA